MPQDLSWPDGQVAELWVYPIKSCAGIRVQEARLLATGLAWDRHWMVVDESGRFITQRTHPQMAHLATEMSEQALQVYALHQDEMPVLSIALALPVGDAREAVPSAAWPQSRAVRVWNSELLALDEGDAVAAWFTEALGTPVRLVRFDPKASRPCSAQWTGADTAHTEFADGFPLLIATDRSVDALNERLQASGELPVDMRRFRANVVLTGFEAHAEDYMPQLQLLEEGTAAPVATLRTVKPCTRCPMPDVDPDTAEQGQRVRQALKAYRRDPRVGQAITFGQNAIVLSGAGQIIREGMRVRVPEACAQTVKG